MVTYLYFLEKRSTRATDEEEDVLIDAGEGCTWVGPINNGYINGQDKKTLTDMLASDCMKICQEETTFDCKSFDYNYGTRTCYLQEKDRNTVKLTTSSTYQYYELDCSRK